MKNFVYVVYTGQTTGKLMYGRIYKAKRVSDGYFITIDGLHEYFVYASLCVLLDGNKVEELMEKFPIGCKVKHRDGMFFIVTLYNYYNNTFWLSPSNRVLEGYSPENCTRIDVEQPELVNNTYQYFFSAQELNGEKECLSNHNPFINGFHWRYYNNTWSLISYCYVGDKCFDSMTTHYGKIKIKNDGRFEWFATPNDYGHCTYKNKEYKQGVVKTLSEAKAKILGFFENVVINPLEITHLERCSSTFGPYWLKGF